MPKASPLCCFVNPKAFLFLDVLSAMDGTSNQHEQFHPLLPSINCKKDPIYIEGAQSKISHIAGEVGCECPWCLMLNVI